MAYIISEYGRHYKPHKNYNEYIADSFDDLPSDAQFGDRAILVEGTTMGFAVLSKQGWISNDGRIKPIESDTNEENKNEVTETQIADLGTVEFVFTGDRNTYMTSVENVDLSLESNKTYIFRVGDMVYKTAYTDPDGAGDVRDDNMMIYMIEDKNLAIAIISESDISGSYNVTISELSGTMDYRVLIDEYRVYFASNDIPSGNVELIITDEDGTTYTNLSQYGTPIGAPGFVCCAMFYFSDSATLYNAASNGKKLTFASKSYDMSDGSKVGEKTYESNKFQFEYTTDSGKHLYGYGYDFIDVNIVEIIKS